MNKAMKRDIRNAAWSAFCEEFDYEGFLCDDPERHDFHEIPDDITACLADVVVHDALAKEAGG
jgi:hypothetical protein